MNPAPGFYAGKVGFLTYIWFLACMVTPMTNDPIYLFKPYNMTAIIFYADFPAAAFAGMVGAYNVDREGLGDTMVLFSGSTVADFIFGGNKALYPRSPDKQIGYAGNYGVTCDLYGHGNMRLAVAGAAFGAVIPGNYLANFFPQWGPIGFLVNHPNATLNVSLGYSDPYFHDMQTDAAIVWFRIVGVLNGFLSLFPLYSFYRIPKKASWVGVALLIEGLMAAPSRLVRCFYEPVYEDTTYEHVWYWSTLILYIDTPYNLTSTFIAAMIWVKILLGRTGKMAELIYNILVGLGAVILMGTCIFVSLIYPLFPYSDVADLKNGLGMDVRQALQTSNDLMMNTSMAFCGLFLISSVYALFSIAKAATQAASAGLIAIVKRMLPWVGLQLAGYVVFITGMWFYNDVIFLIDFMSGAMMLFASLGPQVGMLAVSFGQTMAVFSSVKDQVKGSSSSSSSSSSSTSATTTTPTPPPHHTPTPNNQ